MNVTEKANRADTESPGTRPTFAKRLRSRFVAGLVLVVPIWITVVIMALIFRLLRDTSVWLIEAVLLTPFGDPLLSAWGLERGRLAHEGLAALPLSVELGVSALSVVLTIVLVYVLGAVTTNVLGKRLVRLAERVVDRVPLVRPVYYASKNVLKTITGEESRAFQQVVLVPYPTKQMQSLGFVTHTNEDARTGETLFTVFVPLAPHLTTGFVFVTPQSEVLELNWSMEQALKTIISAGLLMPDELPLVRAASG